MWFLIGLLTYLHNNLYVTERTNHVLLSLLCPLPQRFLVDLQPLQLLNLETNKECMIGGAKGGVDVLFGSFLTVNNALLEKSLIQQEDDTSYHISSQSIFNLIT